MAGSTAPPQSSVHNGTRVLANCKARAFLDVFSNVGIKWHLIRRIVGCELTCTSRFEAQKGKKGEGSELRSHCLFTAQPTFVAVCTRRETGNLTLLNGVRLTNCMKR